MKAPLLTLAVSPLFVFASLAESPVKTEQEGLIPKRETGVLEFLKKHPKFDGRGTVIAVFDTGVDPAADGLQKTSTGKRKIVDVIDATGSGDVNTTHLAEVSDEGTLEGLTGRTLTLPKKAKNPTGKFHLGMKRARDLFNGGVNRRISNLRSAAWKRELDQIRDERTKEISSALKKGERKAFDKAAGDLTLQEKDEIAREELRDSLENNFASSDPGPVYDCVLWSDGKQWRVIIDTDEDGDLRDEKTLRPFGIAGEFGTLSEEEASTFAVQVYEEGNLLSIVTVSGSHGSHVASIASSHFPEEPHRDGVAPGAQILSIKIGDTRMGGSSSGVGEMRGVAACAQYGVDIMNASWGGASQYQDGQHAAARLYNMLVEKYDVTAFVSAGNSGPALSTLGAPGGEASSIIGVGAYVSSEMARVLYSQTSKAPDTAYNFSARGPCKNGDLGVDIMGPGGAQASLAYDELQKSQRYHGTSMSSPSVAGLGALLVSAAKQSKVAHSPARLRAALMNSARFVKNVEVFAQGAGLVQALPAWKHLQKNADEPAWDYFFNVNTTSNTFRSGPGLYLRGDIPVGKKEVRFDLSPKFSEKVNAPEKFALENDLVFTATQPWVKVPGYARLANGRISIRPILDIPESRPGQPLYAEIHGRLATSSEGGPLVRIPITIVRGETTDAHHKHRGEFSVEVESGRTDRRFYQVPPHANFMKVRVCRDGNDTLTRSIILHAVTLMADDSYYACNSQEYLALDSTGAQVVLIPVSGGKTTELAFHQPYFSVGKSSLHVDFEFMGLSSKQDLVNFNANDNHAPLRVITASDETVSGSGSIDRAHYSTMPEKTEFLSPDARDAFPPGPRQEGEMNPQFLRQTFTISVDKATRIELSSARRYSAGSEIGGGLITAHHESGKLLYQGTTYRNSGISLPKGKTTFYRILRSLDHSDLEREEDRPLTWTMKLANAKNLNLYQSMREVVDGRSAGQVRLKKGRHYSLMVGASNLASIGSHKPSPDFFSGRFKLRQTGGEKQELLSIRVECRPGTEFKSTANQKKKAESLATKKETLEKFSDDLFQKRLGFVKSHKFTDKKDLKSKCAEILKALFQERPKDPDLHLLHAELHAGQARLLSDLPKSEAPKKPGEAKNIMALLKEAQALSQPNRVANFFGANSEAEDASLEERKASAAKQKSMESHRNRLAAIALLRADIHLQTGKLKAARQAMRVARKWESSPSKKYQKVELALLRKAKLDGLVLKKINAKLKEKPFDQKLLDEKADLFKKLGFDQRFIKRMKLSQKMRKYRLERGGEL